MKFSELELQLNKEEVTKQAPNGKEFNIRTHISIDEKYKKILKENDLENGQVTASMEVITGIYKEKLRTGF